jgi:hypothetical protein
MQIAPSAPEQAKLTPRQQDMHGFFMGRNVVCPYAYQAAKEGNIMYSDWLATERADGFRKELKQFSDQEKGVFVLMGDPTEKTHNASINKAFQMMRDIKVLEDEFKGTDPEYARLRVDQTLNMEARHKGKHQIHSDIIFPRGRAFAFAMGPAYPVVHPRYAPNLIVIINWLRETGQAMGNREVVRHIREQTTERLKAAGSCPFHRPQQEIEISEVDSEYEDFNDMIQMPYEQDFYVLSND